MKKKNFSIFFFFFFPPNSLCKKEKSFLKSAKVVLQESFPEDQKKNLQQEFLLKLAMVANKVFYLKYKVDKNYFLETEPQE